jgi:hypothetical protein
MSKRFQTEPKNAPTQKKAAAPKGKKTQPTASDAAVNAVMNSAQNAVDAGAASEGNSVSDNTTVNSESEGTKNMATIQLRKTKQTKTFVLYQGEGIKGSVRFLPSQFPEGAVPETISVSVDGEFAMGAAPKVKETKEERKARLAARTPQQIAEDAKRRADRAVERANKLAAKAAEAQGVEPALVGQE